MPQFKEKIIANGNEISVISDGTDNDYISLTDIARYKSDEPTAVIANWMRNKDTIEFLGLWETLYNPAFKPIEFEGFKNQAGANAFTMSPKKWIESTGAIGIISKPGRYGGTFAYKDIAFEFASFKACVSRIRISHFCTIEVELINGLRIKNITEKVKTSRSENNVHSTQCNDNSCESADS